MLLDVSTDCVKDRTQLVKAWEAAVAIGGHGPVLALHLVRSSIDRSSRSQARFLLRKWMKTLLET